MIGSKDDAPPPSSPSLPSVVCCMCGDDGLVRELFRCGVCIFRFQHGYCSNLYPKAEVYGACNWCLQGGEARGKLPLIATRNSTITAISLPIAERSSGCGSDTYGGASSGGLKLVRRPIPDPEYPLSMPIKKQESPERRQPRREELSEDGIRKRSKFLRVKLRRYKLLEEVSS